MANRGTLYGIAFVTECRSLEFVSPILDESSSTLTPLHLRCTRRPYEPAAGLCGRLFFQGIVVSRIFASWNQVAAVFRQIQGLRGAA